MWRVVGLWLCKVRSRTLAHLPFLIEDEKCLFRRSAGIHAFIERVVYRNHSTFTQILSLREHGRRTGDWYKPEFAHVDVIEVLAISGLQTLFEPPIASTGRLPHKT